MTTILLKSGKEIIVQESPDVALAKIVKTSNWGNTEDAFCKLQGENGEVIIRGFDVDVIY